MSDSEEPFNRATQDIHNEGMRRVRDNPVPKGQKFAPGTFVFIADQLGSSMAHFPSGIPARVEYTYAHAFKGDNVKSYSLLLRHYRENVVRWSSTAWYHEHQLTEITNPKTIAIYKEEIYQMIPNDIRMILELEQEQYE